LKNPACQDLSRFQKTCSRKNAQKTQNGPVFALFCGFDFVGFAKDQRPPFMRA
jgi:hypothetical protein